MIAEVGPAAFNLIVFPGFIFSSVFGLILWWLQRKLTARFQWRIGPPAYQTFADIGKLLAKEMVIPVGAVKPLFIAAPILSLASVVTAVLLIPLGLAESVLSFGGDLIVVIYLLIMPSVALILAGAASGNPYGSIGSSRKVTLTVAYELGLIVSLLSVALGAGSLRLIDIARSQFGWFCPLAAAAFFLILLAKVGVLPFDQPEAKTEIMGGVLAEYSGVGLGIFKLSHAILLFALVDLMVAVFFPGPFVGPLAAHPWDVLWHLAKIVIITMVVSLIAAINPRLRIDQALKFFWTYVFVFALINLVAVAAYVVAVG